MVNSEYCFTSFSAQSWQYRDKKKTRNRDYALLLFPMVIAQIHQTDVDPMSLLSDQLSD